MSAAGLSVTLGEPTVNGRATLTAVNGARRGGGYGASTMHAARPRMDDPLKDRNLLSLADLGPSDVAFVLDLARRLQAEHEAGTDRPLLRGRIVGVLGDGPVAPAFAAAVQELGASLAAVSPGLVTTGGPAGLERTAQWLGRLYDAIDVADPGLAARLARHSRVPVFGGLSSPDAPVHTLGTLLTLEQLAGRPLRGLRVAWRGDTAAAGAVSWASVAALAGIGSADPSEADFVLEPHEGQAAVAGRPEAEDRRIPLIKALLVATLR